MYGGLDPEGESYKGCRITLVGKPANAVLYAKQFDQQRWGIIDRLTGASVTEQPDGTLLIEGRSEELINIVGVAPSEATVRWEVTPRGCRDCR